MNHSDAVSKSNTTIYVLICKQGDHFSRKTGSQGILKKYAKVKEILSCDLAFATDHYKKNMLCNMIVYKKFKLRINIDEQPFDINLTCKKSSKMEKSDKSWGNF